MIDLDQTIPQRLPEELRVAGRQALAFAVDPAGDDNPRIGAMWLAVAVALSECATSMERRLLASVEAVDESDEE